MIYLLIVNISFLVPSFFNRLTDPLSRERAGQRGNEAFYGDGQQFRRRKNCEIFPSSVCYTKQYFRTDFKAILDRDKPHAEKLHALCNTALE